MKTPSTVIRRLATAIAGIAVIGSLALVTASSASALGVASVAPQVTFGVQPATAGRLDHRPDFSYAVTPGSTVRDEVAIVNFSSVGLDLHVYATDAVSTSAGGFGLLAGGVEPRDVGGWTSVAGRSAGVPIDVHVPGRHRSGPGAVFLPVEMHVPANASPGDHAGGIVAVLSTVGTNSQGSKFRLDQRVASRLFARVSGTAVARMSVDGVATSYRSGDATLGGGTMTVSYTVHNGGNVSLGAQQSVSVSGPLGLGKHTVTLAAVPLLLPGASVHEQVEVPGVLPLGHLSATVTVHPSHPAGFVDPALPAAAVAHGSVWALPWALLLLLALVAMAALLRSRRRRQVSRSRRHRITIPASPPIRQPELVGPRMRERLRATS